MGRKLYLCSIGVGYDGSMEESCGGAFVYATSWEEAIEKYSKRWPKTREADSVYAELIEDGGRPNYHYKISVLCWGGGQDHVYTFSSPLIFLDFEYPQVAEKYREKLDSLGLAHY